MDEHKRYLIPGGRKLKPNVPVIYNPHAKYCKGCVYHMGEYSKFCQYLFVEDKPRPCPPGKDCTAKIKKRRNRKTADKELEVTP